MTLPTSSQSDLRHLVQNQSHYETDLNVEMKRGWTCPPKADHKVMWDIWCKRKEHNEIDLKCEMKSTNKKLPRMTSVNTIKVLYA